MPRRFVDISVALDPVLASDPPIMQPQVEYMDHQATADQIKSFFPGLEKDQLPDGEGWAVERLTVSSHNGTHLDAPYHHHSTMNRALKPGGEPASTIDEVPLEWCFAPGVKLDFRHMADGYVATAGDVEAELKRIGHELAPLDIVLVNTAAGERYGHPDYVGRGCGLGREATLYLLERGVRVTGTDAWSWDAPFSATAARWAKEGDPSIIWEGHRASMEIGYCHMEKLANLDQLPGHGFLVSCFPYKIKKASAGFTRAVAIFEDT
ncbi:cyclase family protein [Mesorhizobium sp. Z1-4]|uniref:cyclase family protein n=1 Tax=Mesorhizobium sp. Z1-4 TaxID=2448478 RepID=UPI000FDB6DBA|nr:cyclase family protein [Mesorhizobium sp. Z1-4]